MDVKNKLPIIKIKKTKHFMLLLLNSISCILKLVPCKVSEIQYKKKKHVHIQNNLIKMISLLFMWEKISKYTVPNKVTH